MPFNPGVITLDGQARRYRDWLSEFANAGDVPNVKRLLRRVLRERPATAFDPEQVRVHAERIVGLTAPQAAWVQTLFAQLLGDREVAKAINQRNSLVPLRDAFGHAKALRVASQIEAIQVGPRSVILAEMDADAERTDIEDAVNALQAAFGATVIVKPKGIELRKLSPNELVRLRDRLNTIIANVVPGGGGRGGGR